ncbi:hypothetical protein P3S68_001848 [Capsicum galapagoense]
MSLSECIWMPENSHRHHEFELNEDFFSSLQQNDLNELPLLKSHKRVINLLQGRIFLGDVFLSAIEADTGSLSYLLSSPCIFTGSLSAGIGYDITSPEYADI